MAHIASRLGDLLHFHPLAHLLGARESSNPAHEPSGIDAHVCKVSSDDLSHLGLRVEHRKKDPRCDLGQFALLAADEAEGRARIGEVWNLID